MKEIKTDREFLRYEFMDRYNEKCSLQESSLGTEPCIWLGCDHETIHPTLATPCGARMHLTIDMVKELLPKLQYFIDNQCL